MNLTFSRRLALGAGLLLPALETWRRWGQFGQISKWPAIFDDFLAGGFLVLSALACRRSVRNGRVFLASAWGVALGMMYGSFFNQLVALGEPRSLRGCDGDGSDLQRDSFRPLRRWPRRSAPNSAARHCNGDIVRFLGSERRPSYSSRRLDV
jgi:hypothetical protein